MPHNPVNGYGRQDTGRFNTTRHPGNQYVSQVNTQFPYSNFNRQGTGEYAGQNSSTSQGNHKEINNAVLAKG